MKQVEVVRGQTIFDIAIKECGDIRATAEIANLNDISETSKLESGTIITVPDITNKRVVQYYDKNGIVPATSLNDN